MIHIKKNKAGQFYFIEKAKNGETLSVSEAHPTRQRCITNIIAKMKVYNSYNVEVIDGTQKVLVKYDLVKEVKCSPGDKAPRVKYEKKNIIRTANLYKRENKNDCTMMLEQMNIDWESVPHKAENNAFSQRHLDKHRHKFRGQAALVLTLLEKAVKLTSDYAKEVHQIRHLARRIADLGDGKKYHSEFCLDIDREWMLDENREQVDMLVYFLPENRQEFINKKWIIDRPRWWFSEKYTPPEIINSIKESKNNLTTS